MSDWDFLNKARVTTGPMASDASYGFNGLFEIEWLNQHRRVRCMASDGMGWQHVSVSLYGQDKTPSWELMCLVKDLFWEPDDCVIQFHPAKSQYVNRHTGCLHLWRPIGVKLPTPDTRMI